VGDHRSGALVVVGPSANASNRWSHVAAVLGPTRSGRLPRTSDRRFGAGRTWYARRLKADSGPPCTVRPSASPRGAAVGGGAM